MAVDVTWSETNGGSALTSNLDHGNATNGSNSTAKTVHIRHNGNENITSAGLYIRAFSGTYTGYSTAATDIAEMLAWGDAGTAAAFGGFQMNLDAVGGFPAGSWPTWNNKGPSNGVVCRTGTADSESNAVTVPVAAGATAAGTIQTGTSPNVRMECRFVVPSDEDTRGVRQIDQVLKFNFTS
jgi:hypothetical protein